MSGTTASGLLTEVRLVNQGWTGISDWSLFSLDLTIRPEGVTIKLCQAGCMAEAPLYSGPDYDEADAVLAHVDQLEPDALRNLIHLYGE